MKNLKKLLSTGALMIAAACLIFTACTKEGPQGAAGATGPAGKDGTDGKDASETCKQCHAKAVVDAVAVEFQLSKHSWGEAAFEEAGNTTCGPCHEQKAYVYVCTNNTPSDFVFTGGKWVNQYQTDAANAIGEIGCFTCHTSLHTTYGMSDLALTTVAPVSMTMWGGAKTINLEADGGSSNLCAKCHQPRPMTCNTSYDPSGRLLNYDSLKNFPLFLQYDSATVPAVPNRGMKPSYRMHIHYGAVAGVVAGMGAIEFPGTLAYGNSAHASVASCQDCHMADPMVGIAGGHAFNVRNAKESALGSGTTWNFNGCNTSDCHGADPISKTSAKWVNTRATVQGLLNELAAKINACGGGHDILHKDASASNLWWGLTTNNYDGYMDIYDASTNPTGYWKMNGQQPKFPKLLNVQMGAIINFQFCLREYSLGIHNTTYVIALMTNTIKALEDAGL